MKVLVTGGCGYIGTALVPMLRQAGWPVRVLDPMLFGNALTSLEGVEFAQCDIRNEAAVNEAVRGCSHIVHLAGVVTDELVDMNPAIGQAVNEGGTRNLLEAAQRHGIKRFVYASSSSVYGWASRDRDSQETDEPQPMTAYAASKLAGERLLHEAAGKVEWIIARSATCCGPTPRIRLDTIINVFSKQAWYDGQIVVFDGSQWRSNIHVQDAAAWYCRALTEPAWCQEVFNLTAGNDTARGWAHLVALVANREFRRPAGVWTDESKHDERHYRLDDTKLRRAGFTPRYSIKDAVRHNLTWFKGGHIDDPNKDLWYNNRRMAGYMRRADA